MAELLDTYKKRFQELTQKSADEQQRFFQKRFVFTLGDRYWEVSVHIQPWLQEKQQLTCHMAAPLRWPS